MTENDLSKIVVHSCFKIHTQLGPGLLESVYEELLAFELKKQNLNIVRQHGIPLVYGNVKMNIGFQPIL